MSDLVTQSNKSKTKPFIKFFLIYGLLNMAISIMWGAYNNYFPIILQGGNANYVSTSDVQVAGFGLSAFVTGLIMSIDNLFAALFLPIFGAWGDKSTKRRELGFAFGIICVLAFISLPLIASAIPSAKSGKTAELAPLLVVAIVVVFLMMFSDAVGGQFRSGYQFNMVPKEHQSKMASYSTTLGGLGFLFATFVASMLYHINKGIPFYIGGGVMLLVLILFITITPPETKKNQRILEERERGEHKKFNPFHTIAETFRLITKDEKICIVLVFAAKILANFGLYGIQTYGSSYLYTNLGFAPNIAMIVTGVYFIGYMLMAIPIGIIADKINKPILFAVGSGALIIGAIGMLFFAHTLPTVCAFILCIGMAASILDVMTIPYIMSFAPETGTNTGTLFSVTLMVIVCVSLVSVPLLGAVIDSVGNYSSLFFAMIITAALSLILIALLFRFSKRLKKPEATQAIEE